MIKKFSISLPEIVFDYGYMSTDSGSFKDENDGLAHTIFSIESILRDFDENAKVIKAETYTDPEFFVPVLRLSIDIDIDEKQQMHHKLKTGENIWNYLERQLSLTIIQNCFDWRGGEYLYTN